WLRSLESERAQLLEGTEGAGGQVFWSPDSSSIGFYTPSGVSSAGTLRKIDVEGGSARTLGGATGYFGGSWSKKGVILFGGGVSSPLFRISQSGGEAAQLTQLEPNQSSHRYPAFLPDGLHFLFLATGTPEVQGIYVGSLDAQHPRRLFAANSK